LEPSQQTKRHKIRVLGRHFHLPGSMWVRIVLGVLLVFGGLLGFLPILGFWMVPVGLLILSIDIPIVRRGRRRLAVWWGRRRQSAKQQPSEPTR
jgi:uncharacterized membrane protein